MATKKPARVRRTDHFADGAATARNDKQTEQIRGLMERYLESKGMSGSDAMVGREK